MLAVFLHADTVYCVKSPECIFVVHIVHADLSSLLVLWFISQALVRFCIYRYFTGFKDTTDLASYFMFISSVDIHGWQPIKERI